MKEDFHFALKSKPSMDVPKDSELAILDSPLEKFRVRFLNKF